MKKKNSTIEIQKCIFIFIEKNQVLLFSVELQLLADL